MTDLMKSAFQLALCASIVFFAGCTGCGGTGGGTSTTPPVQVTPPTISAATTANTQNGAQMVTLTPTTSGSSIYYTIDGTSPTTSSIIYEAPFLVASSLTVNAIAAAPGDTNSSVTTKTFTLNIPSDTLVWSDDFTNTSTSNAEPDPLVWTYDTGNNSGWGNDELETYCAWGSTTPPCTTATPNAFIAPSVGGLNIVAEEPSSGVYTSARMKTEGLFSFQYGRIEIQASVPEAQGFWPAFWLMGNNIDAVNWPACGEMDVMERIDAAGSPDWNAGSIHGTGFTGSNIGKDFDFPTGQTAATMHTYGMIWSKGSVAYYVDDAASPYVTYTPSSISGFSGAVWPFDSGPNFIILNLAVGGSKSWPGNPDSSTPFPSFMQVNYVKIYAN
ncbi:MAG: family 16 glycosylhydrolase [Terracidiphilus sp.]